MKGPGPLKGCPFCGEKLQINNADLAVHGHESDCFLRQQSVVMGDPQQVARWNARPTLQESDAARLVWLLESSVKVMSVGSDPLRLTRELIDAQMQTQGEGNGQ